MISARSEDKYYYIFIDIFIDEEKIIIDNITNFYSFNKIFLNFFFFSLIYFSNENPFY